MSIERRYWDSDCFLGWFHAEPDKESACREVLEAANDGKVLLVTSALTIAEVLALKGQAPIPVEQRKQVEAFFRNEFIVVQNITRRIAESARSYVWDHSVAPKDALHVATAIDAGLELFNTFDQRLQRKSGQIGNPGIVIAPPSWREPRLPLGAPYES